MKRILLALLVVPAAFAGFINDTVIKETPTLQLITMEWVAAGQGLNTIGGVTLIPLGNDVFKIDVINKHLVGPHGEAVPGPQLQLALNPVTLGGEGGPEKTSGDHGGHFDVMQALLKSTAANSSKLYIRFDHVADQTTVPTIDPAQFAVLPDAGGVPEPASLTLCAAALAALCLRRRLGRAN